MICHLHYLNTVGLFAKLYNQSPLSIQGDSELATPFAMESMKSQRTDFTHSLKAGSIEQDFDSRTISCSNYWPPFVNGPVRLFKAALKLTIAKGDSQYSSFG